jgi:hypothetical protein
MKVDVEPGSEAQVLFSKVKSLRDELVTAWQERAVVLSKLGQERLYDEIKKTCELLSGMTMHR